LLKVLFENYFEAIHGLIHCSGGGQTKCMKYLPGNFRIVKDNLFEPPIIFQLIRQASGSNNREMYQVFNMGHRLEVFTNPSSAEFMIAAAEKLGIQAQIVGRVEASDKKELVLTAGGETILY
jgi:phosphoribosylformylglycinamidine cyclo-ligase